MSGHLLYRDAAGNEVTGDPPESFAAAGHDHDAAYAAAGHGHVGLNVQAVRVTTGSVAGSGSADVTVTWPSAFPDMNYTAQVSIEASDDLSLRVLRIKSRTTTQMVVRVTNDNLMSRTGTIHAVGIPD